MSVNDNTNRYRSPLMRQHDDAPAPPPEPPARQHPLGQDELERIWKAVEDACKG